MSQQKTTGLGQLVSIYETLSENIRFIKRRQWMLAYYVLLADAAIIGIFISFFKNGGVPKPNYLLMVFPFIIIPAGFIYILGIYLLMDIQQSLFNDRKALDKIIGKLPKDIKAFLVSKTSKSFYYGWQYPLSFIVGMSLGLLYIVVCSLKDPTNPNQCLFNIAFIVIIIELLIVGGFSCLFQKLGVKK